jgi:hypothetical protein
VNPGTEKKQIRGSISLGYDAAEYSLGGVEGSWWRARAELKLKIADWFGLWAMAPFARVNHGDSEPRSGLSDTELGFEVRPIDLPKHHLGLILGGGMEFPSGDPHKGLGGGHKALFGQISLTWTPSVRWYLYTTGVFGKALADGHEHKPGTGDHLASSVISPHGSTEVRSIVGAGLVRSFGFVELSTETIFTWEDDVELGPVVADIRVGVALDPQWILVGAVSIPVTDETRYLWKTGLTLSYRWGATVKDDKGCGCANPESH